jgi:hypothetical protein
MDWGVLNRIVGVLNRITGVKGRINCEFGDEFDDIETIINLRSQRWRYMGGLAS